MALRRDPDKSALTAFADELRAHRALAGLSRDELAEKLAYSPSLVAMIETARRTPSRDFAGRCGQALGTPGTFTRLEEIARLYRKRAELCRQLGLKSKETSEVWKSIQF